MSYPTQNADYGTNVTMARRKNLLREKIARTHAKAKLIGVLYLLASIALVALACLPMLSENGAFDKGIWVLNFWKPFLDIAKIMPLSAAKLEPLLVAVLYALVLLTAVINMFRSFGRLGWLFKKKPSRFNGYNRNVYAMDDMGKIFSGTFYVMVVFNLLIYAIRKNGTPVSLVVPFAYIPVALWAVVHFLLGPCGGKLSLFAIENGKIVEEKRAGKIGVPVIRNLFQVAVTVAIAWFIVKSGALSVMFKEVLAFNFSGLISAWKDYLTPILFTVVFLLWLPLFKHATSTTEFDRDGRYASGMATFRVFGFMVFLVAGVLIALEYFFAKAWDMNGIYIAAIAFVWFVVELCLRKHPDDPDNSEEIDPELLFDKIDMQYGARSQAYAGDQNYGYIYYPQQ